jgi:hypothetical protein
MVRCWRSKILFPHDAVGRGIEDALAGLLLTMDGQADGFDDEAWKPNQKATSDHNARPEFLV